jgi:hypothetical protein
MGTNFYWAIQRVVLPTGEEIRGFESDDPRVHIGKRSAAGMYCWDCRITMCKQGESAIHYGQAQWHDACPQCGKLPQKAGLTGEGPVAVELGFAKPNANIKVGVQGCCSFTWAQNPPLVKSILTYAAKDQVMISDEYGRQYTGQEFMELVLDNCPVQFTDSVGTWFS